MKISDRIKIAIVRRIMRLAQDSVVEINDGLTSSEEAVSVCRQMAAEGCILLKNDGNVLPIKVDDKVAVFGRCQNDYFYVGYGSGGDVKAPYRISPMAAFDEEDFPYDKELADTYRRWSQEHRPDDGVWGCWPTCYDEMPLTKNVVEESKNRCNKAIVFIGRSSGEDREAKKIPGSWYLTKEEEKMLKLVTGVYDKVAVIVNAGSFFDLEWIAKYNVPCVLQAWQGGQESGRGLCDVLTGKVNPSGRLTSTLARLEAHPSTANFGEKKAAVYEEDIYVGYRYFETFDKKDVLYPFGYGLSYTTFNIEETEFSKGDEFTYKLGVKVTNTGSVAGRQVVQAYVKVPSVKLGKAEIELAGFAKTKTLEPKESQELTIDINLKWLASYDDTGVTGYKDAYVLEPGQYEFFVGDNVRDVKKVASDNLEFALLKQTKNLCAPRRDFKRLVKAADGKPAKELVKASKSDIRERVLVQLPEDIELTEDKGYKLKDVADGRISMDEFIAQLTVDELEVLCRGSIESMNSSYGAKGNAGVFGATCESLVEKGIPSICANDGPSGVRLQAHSTLFPIGMVLSSSFDIELIEKVGHELGKEVMERNSHVLLAPGMNIHRNPLCGRNFEYFGEDPLMTGLMGAAYVKGVQSTGASAVPKHLACNNQETGRDGCDSVLSTRALREIYLRGFEICISEAEPDFVMTSYNRINTVLNCYNFDLCTELVRNEFGFKGLFMTDWWTRADKSPEFPGIENKAYGVRAGNDIMMPGGPSYRPGSKKGPDYSIQEGMKVADGLTIGEMQVIARRVLTYCMRHV